MFHHLRRRDLIDDESRTATFEGSDTRAGISFFLVDNDPGDGPSLHRHAYPETWIVQAGRASFTLGSEVREFAAGDIVVVEPMTPHRFVNLGPGRLQMTCIHAAEKIVNLPGE